ncbi:ERMES complex subunit mmm1 [Coemansia javaensis]|uniref:Maintenance of mitochondrial morphology protein 1 n=1 Tax=Coemansia javaensis TaxID=2761396 RepID=A0A9W8HQP5_9FUNG|nr:ERMES complex subunit mmm1 [Coemansia javaensis]
MPATTTAAAQPWTLALGLDVLAWQPTFMQGFILGQVSMLVLLVVAIKYLLFEEPLGGRAAGEDSPLAESADAGARRGMAVQEGGLGLSKFTIFSRKQKDPPPADQAEELARMHKEIMSRTGYDLVGHESESCDWLTVFLAQVIAKFRADAERHDRLVRVISEALNSELRPSAIDNIRITQFSLGSDFLRIAAARIAPSAGPLMMRAELDLALHDEVTLGFNTRVLVNWPRQAVAALPVSMVVSLVKFAGTLAVTFDCAAPEPAMLVSILPDYVLEFDVQTLIGSKAKVQNLPMLTSIISRKLQAAFAKELVMPNEKRIGIKHPFTPKAAEATTAAAPAAGHPQKHQQQQQQRHQHHHHHQHQSQASAHSPPWSPAAEGPRPLSPIGSLVAALPPDYNTQLPPPHPLRSAAASRAAAPGLNASSNSPLLGQPQRMPAPDEPAGYPASARTGGIPQQGLRPWSPDPSLHSASPLLRPIVGVSSASALGSGPVGPRFLGAPAPGSSALPGRVASSLVARRDDSDRDDIQVKDSVRQRVNRVIKTVNES